MALLLQWLEEQQWVPYRQKVHFVLKWGTWVDSFLCLLQRGEHSKVHEALLEHGLLLAWNDVAETTFTPLHLVHLVFVLEDCGVSLECLDFLGPVDEGVFFESLDAEVDWLVQAALVEGDLWPHVEHQGHVFMVIHVADLLGCGHSDLEWGVHLEECGKACDDLVFLDALDLSLKVEVWWVHWLNHVCLLFISG